MKMSAFTSLRAYLEYLEASGQLARVRKTVSTRYEITAILSEVDRRGGPAVLFESVEGSPFPIVGALYATRERVANGIGTTMRQFAPEAAARSKQGCGPLIRQDGTAPSQEVVQVGAEADFGSLPILLHHQRDVAPYITSAVCIARDPDSGKLNVSTNRLHIHGPRRAAINLGRGFDLYDIHRRAEQQGKPVDLAVAIGVAPALSYAASSILDPRESELWFAGGLLGQPLEVAPARTIDLLVPATAEVVVEGRILPGERLPEGPFADCTGHYVEVSPKPVFEVTAITRRREAIYHALTTAGAPYSECDRLQWAGRQASIWDYVKRYARELRAINMTTGGMGTFNVVVSIVPTNRGEPKSIISALFPFANIKWVIVVDEDVDVFDPNDVEWALTTRVQADRDLVVLRGGLGSGIDPSVYLGPNITDKIGIDATHKRTPELEERACPHPEYTRMVLENWERYFGVPLARMAVDNPIR